MKDVLTREEFVEMYFVTATDACRTELSELHGIDADAEIERVIDQEYAEYLKFIDITQPDMLDPPDLDDFI